MYVGMQLLKACEYSRTPSKSGFRVFKHCTQVSEYA